MKESKTKDKNTIQPNKGKSIKLLKNSQPSIKETKGAENMSVSNDSKEREKFASIQSPSER